MFRIELTPDWWTLQSKDGKDKYCGEVYMELTFFHNVSSVADVGAPKRLCSCLAGVWLA